MPGPTSTPLPTRTATPTQGAPFVLDRQELVCDPEAYRELTGDREGSDFFPAYRAPSADGEDQ